ncbi:hypothetical protein [Goekera deserti]|nr:hypothetical protein [Goekera deserti]
MGMLKGLLKTVVVQQVITQARKPENQRKAKELVQQLMNKNKGRGPRR